MENISGDCMVFSVGRFLNPLRQKTQLKLTRGSTELRRNQSRSRPERRACAADFPGESLKHVSSRTPLVKTRKP
jgi:hypothetical protein